MAAAGIVKNFGGGGVKLGIDLNCLKQVSREERAQILKARFAHTIAKANEKGEKEHKLLEAKKRQGEARIKALKRKEEIEKQAQLKRRRQQEREAARRALERVETTVAVEDNGAVMKELLMWVRGGRSAWSELGLCLKEEDEDDEYSDGRRCKKIKN